MRAVLQRVVQASVEVNGQQISKIRQGLCVLIGLSVDDTSADLDYMVRKLLTVRVFDSNQSALPLTEVVTTSKDEIQDPPKMWAKSVVDIGGEILCVSQFTLYGQVIKGSKPDFHLSMKSETSKQMYHDFLDRLKNAYKPERIKDGEFGAMMLVNIANDGPVTLELDSRKFEYVPVTNQSSPSIAKAKKAAKLASSSRSTSASASGAESTSDTTSFSGKKSGAQPKNKQENKQKNQQQQQQQQAPKEQQGGALENGVAALALVDKE